MAVLEIQANGDTAVSKEAIVNAGQSLEDALMRVSVQNTNATLHTPSYFLIYFKPHTVQGLFELSVKRISVKHASTDA